MFPSDEEWSWSPNKKPGWMLWSDDDPTDPTDATEADQASDDVEKDDSANVEQEGGKSDHGAKGGTPGSSPNDPDHSGGDGSDSDPPDKTESVAFLTALLDQAAPAKNEQEEVSNEEMEDQVVDPNPGPSAVQGKTGGGVLEGCQLPSEGVLPGSPSPQPPVKAKITEVEVKAEPNLDEGTCGPNLGITADVTPPAPEFGNALLGRKVLKEGRRGVVLMKPMVSPSDEAIYYIRWEDDDTMEQVDCVEEIQPLLCDEFDPNYAAPEVTGHLENTTKATENAEAKSPKLPAKSLKRGKPPQAESAPAVSARVLRKRREPGSTGKNVSEGVEGSRKLAKTEKSVGRLRGRPKRKKGQGTSPSKEKKEQETSPSKENCVRVLPKKNPNDDLHYMKGSDGRWYSKKLCFTPGDLRVEDYFSMEFDGEAEWEVERIVDERIRGSRTQFLVKYTGYEVNPGTEHEKGDWLSFTSANQLKVMDAWLEAKEQFNVI